MKRRKRRKYFQVGEKKKEKRKKETKWRSVGDEGMGKWGHIGRSGAV